MNAALYTDNAGVLLTLIVHSSKCYLKRDRPGMSGSVLDRSVYSGWEIKAAM